MCFVTSLSQARTDLSLTNATPVAVLGITPNCNLIFLSVLLERKVEKGVNWGFRKIN